MSDKPENKKMTVKNLNDKVDTLATKVKDLENIIKILENTISQFEEKHVTKPEENNVTNNQCSSGKYKENFNCKKYDTILDTKSLLKRHIKLNHGKLDICEVCETPFDETWKLEVHMKIHDKEKENKCDDCGKTFHLRWRLIKHKNVHENRNARKCHYFNNQQECPFEDIGCMFLHEKSDKCIFGTNCSRNLCQFQHPQIIPTFDKKTDTMSDDFILTNKENNEHSNCIGGNESNDKKSKNESGLCCKI